MAKLIKNITIANFKSIKNSTIKNCKRINLFIGRPNVGKSNILEALSLFSIPFLTANKSRSLTNLIRCENVTELFYSGKFEAPTYVETNRESATLMLDNIDGLHIKLYDKETHKIDNYHFNDDLSMRPKRQVLHALPQIKKYQYTTPNELFRSTIDSVLLPPFGPNLYSVLERYPDLKDEVSKLFSEYQLELTFDRASRTLKVLKRNNDSIFLIPYNSIADTLQRIIFYKTAIASNKESVLLFEEPEAHSFPPYITHITQEMIYHHSNQYFIATHSPFILNDLLENARDELSVYMVGYKNHETVVKHLSDNVLHDIYQSGVDLFTNSETFL